MLYLLVNMYEKKKELDGVTSKTFEKEKLSGCRAVFVFIHFRHEIRRNRSRVGECAWARVCKGKRGGGGGGDGKGKKIITKLILWSTNGMNLEILTAYGVQSKQKEKQKNFKEEIYAITFEIIAFFSYSGMRGLFSIIFFLSLLFRF